MSTSLHGQIQSMVSLNNDVTSLRAEASAVFSNVAVLLGDRQKVTAQHTYPQPKIVPSIRCKVGFKKAYSVSSSEYCLASWRPTLIV